MSGRSKKITDLDVLTQGKQGDLFILERVEEDGSRTGAISVEDLFGDISTDVKIRANNNLVIGRSTTPTSSTPPTGVPARSIWFDDDFIYVVTSSGTVKRTALQDL